MPYKCQDIERLLNSEKESGIEWSDFDEHLSACEKCRMLVSIDGKLDNAMHGALPQTAPADNYINIMHSIAAIEKSNKSGEMFSILRYLVPVSTSIISLMLIVLNKPLFENAVRYFNLDLDGLKHYFEYALNVKSIVLSEAIRLSASPLLFVAIIGIAFLIWFYSINAVEKATK